MTEAQLQSIARGIAPVVVDLIAKSMQPVAAQLQSERKATEALMERNAVLEHRLLALEQKAAGKDADLDTVATLVSEQVEKLAKTVRDDVGLLIAGTVEKHVAQAVADIPRAKDGVDGKGVEAEEVETLVALHVERAVKALPVPQDGRSVTVEDVAPLVVAEVLKAVERLPVPQNGKDGVGLTGALIDREGQLVVTLSDGTAKAIGGVVGKDADPAEVQRLVVEEVAKIPRPKDGEPGRPGQNGTLENLKVAKLDERTWQLQFKDGTPVEGDPIHFDTPIDRGVFDASKTYAAGDGVTLGGSFWIAQSDTNTRPGTLEGKAWRLAVKEGRPGKGLKGDPGDKGPKGDKGDPGRHAYSG